MTTSSASKQLDRAVVQREEYGPCNICKSNGKLTWDHVPPQGSIEIEPMQQQTVFQDFATCHGGDHRFSISQNGVKFRTLCSVCNNDRLGRRFDPVLNDFTAKAMRNVTSTLALPKVVQIATTPSTLIRAVFGHLLAAKGKIENTEPDEKIRAYFLNETSLLPDGLKVFYWVHPYHNVIIVRDVAMPAVRGRFKETGFFSIIKFFPIGFLVCNLNQYEGLNDLTQYARFGSGKSLAIPLDLKRVEHPSWPEIVDDHNFLLCGQSVQSSILAEPKGTGQQDKD